jgi:NAD(P)H-hydrate epimerase
MKLTSVPEMRAVEEEADSSGLGYDEMMENAGHHLANEVLELAYAQEDEEGIHVLGLVGPGNNGGDTLVALACLAEKGWTARAYLAKRKVNKDPLVQRLLAGGGEICSAQTDQGYVKLQTFIEETDVLLDGVLGTGFRLPLKDDLGGVLAAAQGMIASLEWPPLIIAVDCPSGLDCETGQAAAQTIPADATVTMAAVKQGLLRMPGYALAGEIRVVSIGDLEPLKSWQSIRNEVADQEAVATLLPRRDLDSHKGTFGTAIIAAGSLNYTGAALLAGKAAYRIGAGLVTLAVPSVLHSALAGQFPEATWLLLPHEMGVISSAAAKVLLKNLEHATALLVGPGLGMEDTTREFILELFTGGGMPPIRGRMGFVRSTAAESDREPVHLPPLVLDADGLKLTARLPEWPKLLPALTVLTPHPGEMAILTGLSVDQIQSDRLGTARRYAQEWGHVVVLKGAFTVIADPDGRTTTIPVASPALARAGTGDVLAGLIVGLRAQGLEVYPAAVAGAWLHAQAGLEAAEAVGSTASVLAGDVLAAIAPVLANV